MKKYLILVLFLTLLAGILRFYKNTENPPSLNNDEVAFGYNAYSIVNTGRDEYGEFLPITFKSVGDYKNPVPIYSMVPSIFLFGLNEFSVRLPTALIATLSIPLFYLFILTILKQPMVALIGTALLVISPWHLFYSRFVSDHLMAMTFIFIGVWSFIKMTESQKIFWGVLSGLMLILSIYTYYPERLFVPLFILFLLVYFRSYFRKHRQILIFFAITCALLAIPLIYFTLFGPDIARANMVFISQDIDYTRYVILDHLNRGFLLSHEDLLLIFFWIKRYLNYFQIDYLFLNGLNMTKSGTFGLGVFNIFELPLLVLGTLVLINEQIRFKGLIVAWILIGLLPASLTNNEQSAGRSLLILPPLLLINALGAKKFLEWLFTLKKVARLCLIIVCILFVVMTLTQSFLVFTVHFPYQKADAFMQGSKESILYALNHQEEYEEIVYDPYRGLEAPNVVNIPHMYYLFYSHYDPRLYWSEVKNFNQDKAHFGKFSVRRINWRPEADRIRKDVLFIGSPWSLPEQDLKEAEILKKIYLQNGKLILLIVTPKP